MEVIFAVKKRGAAGGPLAVRRRAGLKSGQELEFKASGGLITIVPKAQTAEDEYTPEQRRIIDARLKKSVEEVKKVTAIWRQR